jgi:hypothetical protein
MHVLLVRLCYASLQVLRLLGFVPAASIARQHFLTSSFVLGVPAG